jgi:hypothetical protein
MNRKPRILLILDVADRIKVGALLGFDPERVLRAILNLKLMD